MLAALSINCARRSRGIFLQIASTSEGKSLQQRGQLVWACRDVVRGLQMFFLLVVTDRKVTTTVKLDGM